MKRRITSGIVAALMLCAGTGAQQVSETSAAKPAPTAPGRAKVDPGASTATLSASSPISSADSVTINRYWAYGDYGNGDIVFVFTPANAAAGCDGAWIAADQPGAKNLAATVMAAKVSATPVAVYLNNTLLWPGSATRYCKVDTMGMR